MNAQYIKGPYHTKPGCGLEIFAGDDKLLMKMATDRPLLDLVPTMNLLLAAPELLEALAEMLRDIEDLVGESAGVAGLHLNGDLAPWGELEEGGRFERLSSISKARAAIFKATGEQA